MDISTRIFEDRTEHYKHLEVVMSALEKALDELPTNERIVFEGMSIHQQSRLQIADQLGMTVWQIDTLHHSARRKLRNVLETMRERGDDQEFCEAYDTVIEP